MKLLFNFLGQAVKTQTARDTGIVFIGQVISTLIAAVFFIIIARYLGPAQLGIYSAAAAIIIILSDTVDLAINSTIIKFGQHKDFAAHWKFAFLLKIGFGLLFSWFVFFTAPLFSLVMHQDLTAVLRVAGFLILAIFINRFFKAVFQAKKKFLYDAFIDVSVSVLRLVITLILISFAILNVTSVFYTQIAASLLAAILALKFISLDFLKSQVAPQIRKDFFSFHSWLTVAFVLAAVHSRIDNLFLMRFSGPEMVGFYQAGYRFFLPVTQFSSVLSTVFAPRFASFSNDSQLRVYLKKTALLSAGLAFLLLLFIAFIPLAIKIIFGQEYAPAILPTQILAPGFAAFVFGIPFISCIVYKRAQTGFFAFLNLVQLVLLVCLDLILIPRFQAVGAAIAVSVSYLLVNSLAVFWVVKKS